MSLGRAWFRCQRVLLLGIRGLKKKKRVLPERVSWTVQWEEEEEGLLGNMRMDIQ